MKFPKFLKRWRNIIVILVTLLILFFIFRLFSSSQGEEYVLAVAEKGNVIQEVNLTGKIKPARTINLGFDRSGRIASVNGKAGDRVGAGTLLMTLENGDLYAQLSQAQNNLEVEKAVLDKLLIGTSPEDLQIDQTAVENAQISLSAAIVKAQADLRSAYDAALTAAQKGVINAKTAILNLTDIQYAYFVDSSSQENINIGNAKAFAVESLLGAKSAGWWTTGSLSPLKGGVFGMINELTNNPSDSAIEDLLPPVLNALQLTKNALESVKINDAVTAAEKSTLNSDKATISSEIIMVSTKQYALAVQKATNESAVASYQNTLNSARDQLAKTVAGATNEEIRQQTAKMNAVQASVRNIQAQLQKTVITAPIDSIITKQDGEPGEIVSGTASVVSLMSDSYFEIEALVPEADIAKVEIGDRAEATTDTYGEGIIFPAEVLSIDPAETMVDNVPTYKTILRFLNQDERIRSGLTANIDITTDHREDVLIIPQRAVISKDGGKFVQRAEFDGKTFFGKKKMKITERKVTTGLRGSDGNIEIIDGLQEGDRVVSFSK